MQVLAKLVGISVSMAVIAVFAGVANGADAPSRTSRAGAFGAARMPSMPTLTIGAIGNVSPNLPSNPTVSDNPGPVDPSKKCPDGATGTYPNCVCAGDRIYNATTNTCDACEYAGQIVSNGVCVCPDGTHADAATKSCVASSDCPDGGVRDSEYKVNDCMNDVLSCVNNGGLPNGIHDLFNEDLRHSIENGMALCSVQVERCVTEIRRNCKNIYRSAADVWIDFNARRVQPEYYNFVLRKTGLTPNQAENTCLLLDRNTYGPSFAAVANNGGTTAEYSNRVGAFNHQNGNSLVKQNPLGATVNTGHAGVDGQRGHYARWDATTADCYLRVAAYNKDTHIKNSWLFGAAGDDRPAEVWRPAGDTFSCNKDLFGFSLMNDTSTAAVVGVGGGTLLGAGIGALSGHGTRALDCNNSGHRKKLMEQIKQSNNVQKISMYLSRENEIVTSQSELTVAQCQDLENLKQKLALAEMAANNCVSTTSVIETTISDVRVVCKAGLEDKTEYEACIEPATFSDGTTNPLYGCAGKEINESKITTVLQCRDYIIAHPDEFPWVNKSSSNTEVVVDKDCKFKSLEHNPDIYGSLQCQATAAECKTAEGLRAQVSVIRGILAPLTLLNEGEKGNRTKTTLVGAGIGAGAGGLATGITALIEHDNINCRVGDGLVQVGFGKSHTIGTLKDFYVKWNLRLPDTIAPTGLATDCNSWRALCGAMTDEKSCKSAQINYRGRTDPTITNIPSACAVAGSVCIENYSVAKSYGACE